MKKTLLLIILLLGYNLILKSEDLPINEGSWSIILNQSSKKLNIRTSGKDVLSDTYAKVSYSISKSSEENTLYSYDADNVVLSEKEIADNFGNGRQYIFTYHYTNNLELEQRFFFYDNLSYFFCEVALKKKEGTISSNYLAPLVSDSENSFLSNKNTNRMLWVPFGNDEWIRYQSYELNRSMTSHEVTAIFEGESRFGLIAGSIEHDTWKSAVEVTASANNKIRRFSCFSGYTDATSYDILPHGKVSGEEIKSAKFLFGYFDDWRTGMDEFGKANTIVAPRLTWDGPTPFGWSSWGGMMEKISYTGVLDVAAFLKDNLLDRGFHDSDGKTVISLDAFWNDNIAEYSIKAFPKKCDDNGQIAGLYYGPFCDFNGDPERTVEGSGGQYKYKDIWLKANGVPHKQGGYCLDPTHPGTKMAMKYNLERYKSWGYKYLKVDFVLNGIIEGDSYYNPEVTTGVQAYNEGMQYMADLVGKDMYIVLAISPLFPYQYAQGRRTGCDSFSQISETEYVMNATSFGWWTNQLYQVNDPDHLVMLSTGTESYGANRARVTSGAVTGAFIFGDNFSDKVNKGFPEQSRERALLFMTNTDINDIPRTCKSFMPVEGYVAKENGAENLLMYHTDKYTYLAVINYNATLAVATAMSFERLGLDPANVVSVKELWTGNNINIKDGSFNYAVSPSDARIYRIEKKDALGIPDNTIEKSNSNRAKVSVFDNLLIINSYETIKEISLYDIDGRQLNVSRQTMMQYDAEINITSYPQGIYILNITFMDNKIQIQKVIFN